MPFFHGYGMNVGLNCIINGRLIVVLRSFDEDTFLAAIQDFKISSLLLAPPLAVFLAKTPKLDNYDLRCVQEIYCGAAPLSKEVEAMLKTRWVWSYSLNKDEIMDTLSTATTTWWIIYFINNLSHRPYIYTKVTRI